jgi:hypothetical protein
MVDQPSLFSPPNNFDDIPEMSPIDAIVVNKDLPNVSLVDLLPEDAVLAVTNSYPLKTIHVTRILNLLSDWKDQE